MRCFPSSTSKWGVTRWLIGLHTALLMVLCAPAVASAQSDGEAPAPETPDVVEAGDAPEAKRAGESKADTTPDGVRPNPFVTGKLETTPTDPNFGRRAAASSDMFFQDDHALARVDRRRELSSMSDRNVLAPMAQTVGEGTISYSNYNFLGNLLTYGVNDKLAVTGGVIIPTGDGDLITSVSGKYKLHESRNWIVSVLPFGVAANGTMNLDTYQYGLGSGLLADFHVSDTVVLSGGLLGFATLFAGYDRYSDDCTRSEFQSENCPVDTVSKTLPAGGHWIAATLGTNWFVTDSFSVNFEYILGGSWGTFFGVEDNSEWNDLESRRARFENPEFDSGFPHGQGPTISLGGTWSNGTSALQFALVFVRRQDDLNTLVVDESQEFTPVPMLSGAFNF